MSIKIFKKAFYRMLHHLANESRRNLVLHQDLLTFVKMERNIKTSIKISYRIAECRIEECCTFN